MREMRLQDIDSLGEILLLDDRRTAVLINLLKLSLGD